MVDRLELQCDFAPSDSLVLEADEESTIMVTILIEADADNINPVIRLNHDDQRQIVKWLQENLANSFLTEAE